MLVEIFWESFLVGDEDWLAAGVFYCGDFEEIVDGFFDVVGWVGDVDKGGELEFYGFLEVFDVVIGEYWGLMKEKVGVGEYIDIIIIGK